jgi:hypothetical protein
MLVEVGVICVILAQEPERCSAGERVFRVNSDVPTLILSADWSHSPNIVNGLDLETSIARDLALVEQVHHILIERAEGNLLVWISVDNPVKEVRERIFQKELLLIEGFPEVDFDFNIVPSMSRDPREIATSAKVVYSRPEGNAIAE